jgi:hypothetical protein
VRDLGVQIGLWLRGRILRVHPLGILVIPIRVVESKYDGVVRRKAPRREAKADFARRIGSYRLFLSASEATRLRPTVAGLRRG